MQGWIRRARDLGMITSGDAVRLHAGVSPTGEPARASEMSLRELARRPRDERHGVLRGAAIEVDADETDWWDAVAADGLD